MDLPSTQIILLGIFLALSLVGWVITLVLYKKDLAKLTYVNKRLCKLIELKDLQIEDLKYNSYKE